MSISESILPSSPTPISAQAVDGGLIRSFGSLTGRPTPTTRHADVGEVVPCQPCGAYAAFGDIGAAFGARLQYRPAHRGVSILFARNTAVEYLP